MTPIPPVAGFIGLGAMGGPMAAHLADVVVYDIRPAACAPFANVATSPAEMAARADIVFACLTDPADFRAVVSELCQGGRIRHYVHLGTSGSTLVRELADTLAAHNIALLDCPITGGPGRARAGTLTAMAAGPAETYALAAPLIAKFASKLVALGPEPGAAQTMKVINNAISLANLAVASDAMLLGAKAASPPRRCSK